MTRGTIEDDEVERGFIIAYAFDQLLERQSEPERYGWNALSDLQYPAQPGGWRYKPEGEAIATLERS